MRQVITIEALEVLDAIERKGSFAAAADELYRVPSAITYTVQKLEQDLGVTLFRREGRRSVLTPAGQELLNEGRHILAATAALAESARRVASGWEPRLNIAMECFFPLESLYPLLQAFYQIYPDIEFNLYEEVLAGSWDALLSGCADLVIGAPDLPPVHKGITAVPLMELESVMVASAGHPATQLPQPLAREDLEQFRSVVARDSSRNLPHQSRGLQTPKSVLSVPNMEAKIRAHCQGLGVGTVPRYRVAELLASGELVELRLREPLPPSSFYIGWRASNKGKALEWMVTAVRERWQF